MWYPFRRKRYEGGVVIFWELFYFWDKEKTDYTFVDMRIHFRRK